jgi:hypothetical protein
MAVCMSRVTDGFGPFRLNTVASKRCLSTPTTVGHRNLDKSRLLSLMCPWHRLSLVAVPMQAYSHAGHRNRCRCGNASLIPYVGETMS